MVAESTIINFIYFCTAGVFLVLISIPLAKSIQFFIKFCEIFIIDNIKKYVKRR